jgi:hypothetical protein
MILQQYMSAVKSSLTEQASMNSNENYFSVPFASGGTSANTPSPMMPPPPSPFVHMGDIYRMTTPDNQLELNNPQNDTYHQETTPAPHSSLSLQIPPPPTPMIHLNDIYTQPTSSPSPMHYANVRNRNQYHPIAIPNSARSISTTISRMTSIGSDMKSPMLMMGELYSMNSFVSSQENGMEESVIRGGYIKNCRMDISRANQEDVIPSSVLRLHRQSSERYSISSFTAGSTKQLVDEPELDDQTMNPINMRAKNVYPTRFAPFSRTMSLSNSPMLDPSLLLSAVELDVRDNTRNSLDKSVAAKIWRQYVPRWKPLLMIDSSSSLTPELIPMPASQSKHLIVLVHGFQGSSADMRLLACQLLIAFPNNLVLCTKSNDRHNEDSIKTMSHRVAEEVLQYCRDRCPDLLLPNGVSRISFIAHSMGGLVVRKALEVWHFFSCAILCLLETTRMTISYRIHC